jgi:hypothetical protein
MDILAFTGTAKIVVRADSALEAGTNNGSLFTAIADNVLVYSARSRLLPVDLFLIRIQWKATRKLKFEISAL